MTALSVLITKNLSKEILFERLLIVFFSAGVLFHLIPFFRPYVLKLTDIFLFISNGIVLWFVFSKSRSFSLIIWCFLVFLITYLAELAGILTGEIFGSYLYGKTMIFQVMNVPVVIAFNWLILILATISISSKLVKPLWLIPIISSLLIVAFDYVMEPVAMHLDYWQWANDIIPLQNYIAWFFISLVFASIFVALRLSVNSRILRTYFFIQLFFFLVLRIGL